MNITAYVFIFWTGWVVGFFLALWYFHRMKNYAGTIVVSTGEHGATRYSLVLDDFIENLEFQDEVTFRIDAQPPKPSFPIDTSKESSNRE